MSDTGLILTIFVLTYIGMALGRFPGLRIDRTGIALLGAIVLVVSDAVPPATVIDAIDFPTLFILFGLMILSAQFDASGFYDWCSLRIAALGKSPVMLLAVTIGAAGMLSAVLANDVVVFAMTPLLCIGLQARGLDPRPYLIGLAGGANAGSAATMIGNPQNILIAQLGDLDFWAFLAACGVPALIGLAACFGTVWLVWRDRLESEAGARIALPAVALDRSHLVKALVGTLALLILFASPLPHAMGVLIIAGGLLVSRRVATRQMLDKVDWPLLVLFAGLFVVTAALSATGLPGEAVAMLSGAGLSPDRLAVLAPVALIGSNTIGNVPAVILLLAVWPELSAETLYGLAILSTLAGNLLIIGSLANIIVVERAKSVGITLGFAEHARCGIPMTLVSLAGAVAWLWLTGLMPLS
ncbi:MAG: anion transporter [Alphaproteobacteria bacterium]|nr:anion transporter [Alphaproteobacteria bacterium]MBU0799020.1 anion transporter [Alphaproteobacteria bacterium]MBU0889250.1 anion transporter [Alphaproteobacteria bacterium]MBU1815066.1 anion transporter [Alphaproteobacteria bacterium]